jgi:hypothetical protein
MTTSSIPSARAGQSAGVSIWLAGLLAVVLATALNVLLWAAARSLFEISDDMTALTTAVPTVFFTIIGVVAATVVYAIMQRRAHQPRRTFTRVALIALAVSLLPDIALLASDQPGASAAAVGTLMAMHFVAAAVCIVVLTRAGRGDA